MKTGILNTDDLFDLTTYRNGGKQMDALRGMGLRPYMGRDGHPRITWEAVNQAMSAPQAIAPNWNSLRKAG